MMVGPEWRLKEKLNMRKAELKDLSLAENPELKMAFELKERNQPGFLFFPSSEQERREWMAALTNLLTRRLVDAVQDIMCIQHVVTYPRNIRIRCMTRNNLLRL